jgi:hypothetical protein
VRPESQPGGCSLVEDASLRGQQNDRDSRLRSEHAFDGGEDWFRLHDHPTTAAVRHIIGNFMLTGGIVADIVDVDVQQAALSGALKDTAVKIGGENFR